MTAPAESPPGEAEPLVELLVEEPAWEAALPELAAVAEQAAALALREAGQDPARWQIALLACSDARIAALNAQFRGKDRPTDVLSWPAFDTLPEAPAPRTPLGDIAISLETIRGIAEEHAIPLKERVLHLILHGCLHLLGYDHQTARDAERMEGLERGAMARAGLPDPYGERGAARPLPEE